MGTSHSVNSHENKGEGQMLDFEEVCPVIPGYCTGWPFPKKEEDPDARAAWKFLGFSEDMWPVGEEPKDPFPSAEAPASLNAPRTPENRRHYTRYWKTMITDTPIQRKRKNNEENQAALEVEQVG